MGEAHGLSVMKFTLVYEGELKANGNPTKKQAIRDKLHPQLVNLWDTHPCMLALKGRRYVSIDPGGHMWFESHHHVPIPKASPPQDGIFPELGDVPSPHIDLLEPVVRKGCSFTPLVRERTALKCALKITFLRQEEPGRVYQGGDIDNRLKTLLDALAVPQHDEQVIPRDTEIFCLLEDDNLITGLDVQTQRLLGRSDATKHEVHLLIEVDVRVTNPRGYNQMFLGD